MSRNHKTPIITCRKCNGKGKVLLSEPLDKVFFIVKTHSGIDAPAINKILRMVDNGFSTTAVNQRLNDLVNLNLIERTRIGASFQYFVKGK